jgi:hypothetical protein
VVSMTCPYGRILGFLGRRDTVPPKQSQPILEGTRSSPESRGMLCLLPQEHLRVCLGMLEVESVCRSLSNCQEWFIGAQMW